jgi:hypothetical protein
MIKFVASSFEQDTSMDTSDTRYLAHFNRPTYHKLRSLVGPWRSCRVKDAGPDPPSWSHVRREGEKGPNYSN